MNFSKVIILFWVQVNWLLNWVEIGFSDHFKDLINGKLPYVPCISYTLWGLSTLREFYSTINSVEYMLMFLS